MSLHFYSIYWWSKEISKYIISLLVCGGVLLMLEVF